MYGQIDHLLCALSYTYTLTPSLHAHTCGLLGRIKKGRGGLARMGTFPPLPPISPYYLKKIQDKWKTEQKSGEKRGKEGEKWGKSKAKQF